MVFKELGGNKFMSHRKKLKCNMIISQEVYFTLVKQFRNFTVQEFFT